MMGEVARHTRDTSAHHHSGTGVTMRKFTRRDDPAVLDQRSWADVPGPFIAVAEALAAQSDPSAACEVVGRKLAADGAGLVEALDALRLTRRVVTDADPTFAEIRALSVAWSEETLGYLNQLSCQDPLTGVASMAHVRARVAEVFRGEDRRGRSPSDTFALVVVDVTGRHVAHGADFEQALRLSRVAETVRTVFQGSETVGRAGAQRLVILGKRHPSLGKQVALLETLLLDRHADIATRVWIEGLPDTERSAAVVLDELSRA